MTVESEPRALTTPAQILSNTVRSPQFGSLIAMAAAITLGVGLIMYGSAPEYTPINENLQEQDVGELSGLLSEARIDYKVDPNSGALLVPRKSLSEVRMLIAASGLGGAGDVGLEVLQQQTSLGTSQFVESARYQHALETELSRTISSLRNIRHARVHLAMPKQSVFIRNRVKASASVIVHPLAGRIVEAGQVASIVNLVASSIPYLESTNVTVVDQWGRLLSNTNDGNGTDLTNAQFEYTRKLERLLSDRVESLLTPLVGEGRLRASVTADVDFTVNEQTQEIYEPDPEQIRSEETRVSESAVANLTAAGVPGALTNQPNGVDPLATQQPNTRGVDNQTTRNYELDKTIRHTRQSPSVVRRLSAAIIVDDRLVINDDGVEESVPVSQDEIDRLTALAKEAIGFDEGRGDSVIVFNQSFQPTLDSTPLEPVPVWKDIAFSELTRQIFVGLAILMLIFMVVRPAMKNFAIRQLENDSEKEESDSDDENDESESEEGTADGEEGVADGADPEALPPPGAMYGDILDVARNMAKEDPERVARIVKEWVVEEQDAD
ncbi:MAG: flagellar M-ring protein FliF [Gammaproteobacteria bacterium]|nr:flagellar M-ring protein FliF [Gammaproteobacteria bacterium]